MTDRQSKDFLNELQLGDNGRPGSLRHLALVIGDDVYNLAKNSAKERVVAILSEYYCTPNRFEELWNRLSDAERKIISLHIWGNGSEPTDYADQVAEEFGIAEKQERTYYFFARNGLDRFKERYAQKNSLLWVLFPKHGDSRIFYDELRDAVGEMKRVYSNVLNKETLSTREGRTADFMNIVRYCNSNRVAVTKNGVLSKSSALKLQAFCGYEEYAADININPEDVRTTEGLLVTFPLNVICTIGGLITANEGECIPGGKSFSLINLPYEQLVKKLFEAYLKNKSFDEVSIMKGIKSRRGHNPSEARQNIAKELKYCPLGQPVYTKEFERYLRLASKFFARKDEKYVIETGNNYYEYGAEWELYEYPLISIILSFFGALGIIDIAWGEDSSTYAHVGRRVPVAFRINPLGAYVLGLSEAYTAPIVPKPKNKGGFTVLPDYTIFVPDSSDRIKHEMYFEKLFTKVSTNDQVSVYKLDFETVIRVIDNGSCVADLSKYLSASDKPMPENVTRALADWEKQASRIRIRQVTILECDDAALLEEVIRYKGMGEYIKEKVCPAVVVDSGSTNKIKKVIEKNKRFCVYVI